MKLSIHKLTRKNKILRKYICIEQGGDNISPKISWKEVYQVKSYALILEDPDAIKGTFIHWYIPYIDKDILEIDELNHGLNENIDYYNIKSKIRLVQGKNSLGTTGYYGPCAPNKKDHHYTFYIYALDQIIKMDNDPLVIEDHHNFELLLKGQHINILNKDSKIFKFHYKNYYTRI